MNLNFINEKSDSIGLLMSQITPYPCQTYYISSSIESSYIYSNGPAVNLSEINNSMPNEKEAINKRCQILKNQNKQLINQIKKLEGKLLATQSCISPYFDVVHIKLPLRSNTRAVALKRSLICTEFINVIVW